MDFTSKKKIIEIDQLLFSQKWRNNEKIGYVIFLIPGRKLIFGCVIRNLHDHIVGLVPCSQLKEIFGRQTEIVTSLLSTC
jgi:hypothetical protein